MIMTPEDIQTQQFHVRFRGFDVEEVDSFLEKTAEAYLAQIEENKTLEVQVEQLTKEMAARRSQEKSFQNALIAAQKITEEMKEKSERKALELLSEAREEASQIRQEAHREVAGLEQEVDHLKKLKSQIQAVLRKFLQSYLDQLGESSATTAAGSHEEYAAAQDDVSDLYEKIDLPDDLLDVPPDAITTEDEDTRVSDLFAEEAEQSAIPDMDSDMVFDLEDPLDDNDHEPAVTIDDDRDKGV